FPFLLFLDLLLLYSSPHNLLLIRTIWVHYSTRHWACYLVPHALNCTLPPRLVTLTPPVSSLDDKSRTPVFGDPLHIPAVIIHGSYPCLILHII
ncbi:hypothetical protein ASPFODRAFT_220471, partial [Aspergillus luchuensis CBS 106.47]